jgi:hypothetical protein
MGPLGSYFPSWIARWSASRWRSPPAIFKACGLLEELPVPFVVMLAIASSGTISRDTGLRRVHPGIISSTTTITSCK